MKKITSSFVKRLLPQRTKNSSKIDGGRVLIVGGGTGLYGAGILSALAATRSGAGYVYLMTDLIKFPWLKFPDFIVSPILPSSFKKHRESVVAIGPGLGLTKSRAKLITYLIKNNFLKVVVDGDGLTLLSRMKVKSLPVTWILTPHEGELARLMNVSSLEIKKKRVYYATQAQKKYGCIIILKGAETIIATTDHLFITNSGTKALAKAGSGDVLTGMIAAFYAQKADALEACFLGTFIHGYTSQLWLKKKNDFLSMRPIDLIDEISRGICKLRAS